MSVRWTRPALRDLASIGDEQWRDRDYVARVGRPALAAGRFLARHPRAGPPLLGGLRKWRVRTTDHVIVYRVVAADIEIIRVHHGREDWRPSDRDGRR